MHKYTIIIFFIIMTVSNSFGQSNYQSNSWGLAGTYLRVELPISFNHRPKAEQTILSPNSLTNSDIRIIPKFGAEMDILLNNGFGFSGGFRFYSQGNTKDYINEHYRNETFNILDKELNESVRNYEFVLKMYYYKELNENHGMSYDFIIQNTFSRLTDNIIVHAEKNPGIYTPIVEFKEYNLEEFSLGLGINYFMNINSNFQFYTGLQGCVVYQIQFDYKENYFDDYYIYKNVKGVDLPDKNNFDLKNRIRFNLIAGIRFKLK